MTVLKPFCGLRPRPDIAQDIASVPYDVVNTDEARALAADNNLSFLRVIRSEIEFEKGSNPYSLDIYEKAKQNLNSLIANKALIRDPEPSLYLYRLESGGHSQTGVVGCSAVDDYESGKIKLHEKTKPEKEKDRTQHMLVTKAHTGPVFLAYRNCSEIEGLITKEAQQEPLYDFVAPDGVRHTLWRALDTASLENAFLALPHTYVADGHHRAASARNCRTESKKQNSAHTGREGYNFFLSVLFSDSELKILPYNRIIRSIEQSPDEVVQALKKVYQVRESYSPSPQNKGDVSMYLDGKWYGLSLPEEYEREDDPVEALDVSILYKRALNPIFGIQDLRTDKNIDFIGGGRGTEHLEKLVQSGEATVAFSLYPVSVEELLAVADLGRTMAPKSTWFEPKLRSGLIIHSFE